MPTISYSNFITAVGRVSINVQKRNQQALWHPFPVMTFPKIHHKEIIKHACNDRFMCEDICFNIILIACCKHNKFQWVNNSINPDISINRLPYAITSDFWNTGTICFLYGNSISINTAPPTSPSYIKLSNEKNPKFEIKKLREYVWN